MRIVRWLSAALWAGSWILMVLEVFRWHHLTPTLQFRPDLPPGVHGVGHLGLPAQTARACAFVAPAIFLATLAWSRTEPRTGIRQPIRSGRRFRLAPTFSCRRRSWTLPTRVTSPTSRVEEPPP